MTLKDHMASDFNKSTTFCISLNNLIMALEDYMGFYILIPIA